MATSEADVKGGPSIKVSAVKLIGVNRVAMDPLKLKELAASIASRVEQNERGVLVPMIARKGKGDTLELIAGHRRFTAITQELKYKEIPRDWFEIVTADDVDVPVIRAIENLQREDLHPMDEVEQYAAMLGKKDPASGAVIDAEWIGRRIGKSARHVGRRLVLRDLPPKAKEAYRAGKLTVGVAYGIARLPQAADRDRAYEYAKPRGGAGSGGGWQPNEQEFHRWVLSTIYRNLSNAPFDPKDAKLVPAAGPCTTCPKRSGNNELFDAKVEGLGESTCLDAACFQTKADAAAKLKVAELKASGVEVLPEKAAAEKEKKALKAKLLPEGHATVLTKSYGYQTQTYVQVLGELYKTQCTNKETPCPHFAFAQVDGNKQPQPVCFNGLHLRKLLRQAQREKDRGGEDEPRERTNGKTGPSKHHVEQRKRRVAESIREYVDRWLMLKLVKKAGESHEMIDRMALLFVCAQFSKDSYDAETAKKVKAEFGIDVVMAHEAYDLHWAKILSLPHKKVVELLTALVVLMAPEADPRILHDVGKKVGVDPGRQYALTAEDLDLLTKDDLAKVAKELGENVEGFQKKTDIVSVLAPKMKAGKLPKLWSTVIEGKK